MQKITGAERSKTMIKIGGVSLDVSHPMGFAEVTLVLDNKDRNLDVAFDEVEVTRKTYA